MSMPTLDNTFTTFARQKAFVATIGFAFFGALGAWHASSIDVALPLVVFYSVLVVNTYFSIRCFASITPREDRGQQMIDIAIGGLMAVMPYFFSMPVYFGIGATLLFGIATEKYVMLRRLISYPTLLRRKIRIDALGFVACLLATAGLVWGPTALVGWIWSVVFIIANLYLFFVRPLYRISA